MLINADIGEKDHLEELDSEFMLLPYLDMLNIACGGHAGNQMVMSAIIKQAKKYNAKIGAHPSYPDRENFGRISRTFSPQQMYNWLGEQLQLFIQEATKLGSSVHHIKPHGALYHDLMQNEEYAHIFMDCVGVLFPENESKPFIVGLADSALEKVVKQRTFPFMPEAFIDRKYLENGQLQSRKEMGSVLNPDEAIVQFRHLKDQCCVTTTTGKTIRLRFETLCVHSDSPGALATLKSVQKNRPKLAN